MVAFVRNFLVKMILSLLWPLTVVMTGANAAGQIATDQKDYDKCSSSIIPSLLNSQNISINKSEKGWLLGHLRRI